MVCNLLLPREIPFAVEWLLQSVWTSLTPYLYGGKHSSSSKSDEGVDGKKKKRCFGRIVFQAMLGYMEEFENCKNGSLESHV